MKLMKLQRPTLTAWPSVGRLADLRDEIDRLFDSPLNGFGSVFQSLGDWSPALDIHENKENFIVKAELPGISKEDVNVSFQDGCLTISGERKAETKNDDTEAYHTERFFWALPAHRGAACDRGGRQDQGPISRRRADHHRSLKTGRRALKDLAIHHPLLQILILWLVFSVAIIWKEP